MNGSQMPRRNRDKRQVNAAIGMCIGLAIGAVGMVMCTRLGYEEYANHTCDCVSGSWWNHRNTGTPHR